MADPISGLEADLEAARREFERYFLGLEKRLPAQQRDEVSKAIRRYSPGRDAVDKFRHQGLVQRLEDQGVTIKARPETDGSNSLLGYFLWWPDWEFGYLVAFGIYCLMGVTDYFDGYLARSSGAVSKLGIFLDPIADKIMVAAVILILTAQGLHAAAARQPLE